MKLLWALIALAAVVFVAAAVWRFIAVRNSGTPAIMRALPSEGDHGWRHGVIRYSGETVSFYMLRSLSFRADAVFSRHAIDVTGRRQATETEKHFMPGVEVVLLFSSEGQDYEFATNRHAAMALISWVESAPDRRQVRSDMNDLHNRAFRGNF